MNPFSSDYVSQLAPVKKIKTGKPQPNAFDTDDHKARQACVHLPKVSTQSRADVIRRSNSKV